MIQNRKKGTVRLCRYLWLQDRLLWCNQEETGNQEETVAQEETGAQGEQKETAGQTNRKENVTGNTDNPQTWDGTLDNNKPDYEVFVNPNGFIPCSIT